MKKKLLNTIKYLELNPDGYQLIVLNNQQVNQQDAHALFTNLQSVGIYSVMGIVLVDGDVRTAAKVINTEDIK